MNLHHGRDLSATVAAQLPYLRRYARALAGTQQDGDRHALAALQAVVADPGRLTADMDIDLALFSVFHQIWSAAPDRHGVPGPGDNAVTAAAQKRLGGLTTNSREALLLHSIEGFSVDQVASIIATTPDEARELIDRAISEMADTMRGRVMVIEDEAIIAMDIAAIVESLGHGVTGVASTRDEAVQLAAEERPDLILADIQLADNSSGIDAVNDILARFQQLPVVFITAFPERLLTGERPEPAFIINKPYTEEQLRSAVSQAMFFSSTETLGA